MEDIDMELKLNGVTLDEKLLSLGLEFINEKIEKEKDLSDEELKNFVFNESIEFVKRFNYWYSKPLGEYDRRYKLTESDVEEIKLLRKKGMKWEEITKKYGVSQVAIFYRLNPKMKNKRNDYNKNYNKLPKIKTEKMKEYIANSVKNTYRYKKELCARGLL